MRSRETDYLFQNCLQGLVIISFSLNDFSYEELYKSKIINIIVKKAMVASNCENKVIDFVDEYLAALGISEWEENAEEKINSRYSS